MQTTRAAWMRNILLAAAVYNIVWGTLVVIFPRAAFEWVGIPAPIYPELWQCIGMIVGVYGVAYAVAAFDPLRHWPVIFAGLLGKILGPVGFLKAAVHGRLPWKAGWTVVGNDLIWWVPFSWILIGAYRSYMSWVRALAPEVLKFALRSKVTGGTSIEQYSKLSPVLLVFLRHAGCPFCREALADISEQRRSLEAGGTKLILVHMGDEQRAAPFFSHYGLGDVPRISDPNQTIYRAFGLRRASLTSLFGPKVWLRAFQAGILRRHGWGKFVGDICQMPGVFLIYHGEVLRSYRHQSVADRPDYGRFIGEEPFNTASVHV